MRGLDRGSDSDLEPLTNRGTADAGQERGQTTYEEVLEFGPFRLLCSQRQLLKDGRPVRVGGRAFEVLRVLVEMAGSLVSKEDLIARVWPDTKVEEANLRVHLAALRKILGDRDKGDRYILNVPSKGYTFVAPLTRAQMASPASQAARASATNRSLPTQLTRIIGRLGPARRVGAQMSVRRLASIVGPGGIGKTTLAIAIAEEREPLYEHGVVFVDLAALVDDKLVPSALATALGTSIPPENEVASLGAFLADKKILILLDNCEHVIESVAMLAESVLRAAPAVHILATSREPLRAQGEWVHRLASLDTPPTSAALTASEALSFPSVQLFVERAMDSADGYQFMDSDALIVADLCRRLDGIPLAIELAASRIGVFGARGLADRLDDRFRLLTKGRRTALPHHRTLRAAIDWSYDTLSKRDQLILRRLAVFRGPFELDGAIAAVGDKAVDASSVIEGLMDLVAKSLVSADASDRDVRYRLLHMTRGYAWDKLTDRRERLAVSRRHAEYHRDILAKAEVKWSALPRPPSLQTYSQKIDDVRGALDWASSADGDPEVAVELTIAAVPLWFQLSLFEECRQRVVRALSIVRTDTARDLHQAMQLQAARANVAQLAGASDEAAAAWEVVLAIADRLRSSDYKLRALWGMYVVHFMKGDNRSTLKCAELFLHEASDQGDQVNVLIGARIVGCARHLMGDHIGARAHIERILKYPFAAGAHVARFQFDQSIAARAFRARVFWLQGDLNQALSDVEKCMEQAEALAHMPTLFYALVCAACPVSLAVGDISSAARFVAKLGDCSAGFGTLRRWTSCYEGLLEAKRGRHDLAVRQLREAVANTTMSFSPSYLAFRGGLAESLTRIGQFNEAIALADESLEASERMAERWCIPHLLRVKGDALYLRRATNATSSARELYVRSLSLAREQKALFWELESAVSMARLLADQNRHDAAAAGLDAVLSRWNEGLDTNPLLAAQRLRRDLHAASAARGRRGDIVYGIPVDACTKPVTARFVRDLRTR